MSNYSVNTDLQVRTNAKSFVPPGITEKLNLVKTIYGVSPKGFEYISFNFEDEFGDTFSHSEYQPTMSKPFEAMNDQEKQSYLSAVDTQKRRIGQIVTTFVPREKYSFVANTFKEFAENIIRILDERDKSILCRGKIVLNKKNWTTFPSYWKYTFIESMAIPKEESKIRILNIDNIVKKEADIESIPDEGIDIPEVEDQPKKSDLPF